MMRRRVLSVLWSVVVAGCSATQPDGVISSAAVPAPPVNLALGPSADHAYLATLGPVRSDWPAVENGYRLDEVTFYTRASYDAQFHFDRNNSIYHQSEMVQTGVHVR